MCPNLLGIIIAMIFLNSLEAPKQIKRVNQAFEQGAKQ